MFRTIVGSVLIKSQFSQNFQIISKSTIGTTSTLQFSKSKDPPNKDHGKFSTESSAIITLLTNEGTNY